MSGDFLDASRRLILLAAAAGSLAASGAAVPEGDLVPLPGSIHRLARTQFDVGESPSSLPLHGLDVVFANTPGQKRALRQLLSAQQDPKSAQYHKWLTPADYGRRFGATDATLAAVTSWLQSNGLAAGEVPAARGHLPFFGSKSQVEGALHTRVHLFEVRGERHYANVSDPMIPGALQPVLAAIRGLNDFHPRPGVRPLRASARPLLPMIGRRSAHSLADPDTYYSGSGQYPGYVGPTDFAVIYNLLPEYQQGITGIGVTVAIAAQSDLDPSVLTAFWSGFGVAGSSFGLPAQQFESIPVPAADGGADPGQTKDINEDEAYLDAEIVGGLAPGAHLLLVRDKNATLAAQYVIDQNLAAILNISFGDCESDLTQSGNAAINSMFAQAAGEGISVTVSSDDAGVAGCTAESDVGKANDVNSAGLAVNGLASTPYDLAVGGTDFDPSTETPFWSLSNQAGTRASAISHIPEMAWNDSCANPVLAQVYGNGDPIAFCNTAKIGSQNNPYMEIFGSGGGLSSCTTTDAGGNCTGGYAQPSWQQNLGAFGARALPDVAMVATRWLMCSYDTTPCDPAQAPTFPPASSATIKVLDGTSAAAPSVAAIIALLDQTQITTTRSDGRQGLVNPLLYQLAASEYVNPAAQIECNASQGPITSSLCVFYDITNGSNAQPCSVANYAANSAGTLPASTCVSESGDATGIMEVNSAQDYNALVNFDLATGLGSINASALIGTIQGTTAPSNLTASTSGQTATLTWSADAGATLGYDVYEGIGSGPASSTPVQRNVVGTSTTVAGLQFGQRYVFAVAAVSSSGVSPQSSEAGIMTVPASPAGLRAASSGAGALTLSWTASSGASTYQIFEGTASGAENKAPVVTGVQNSPAKITALASGRQYFFKVSAVDTGGASLPSAEAKGTVVPSTPGEIKAAAGNGSVSLSWTSVAGASGYNIYVGTHSNGEAAQPQQTTTTASAAVTGLSNGTTYYFTVAAVDAGGASTPSSQVSAAPVAPSSGGGGGGAMGWLALAGLAVLLGTKLGSLVGGRFARAARAAPVPE